MRFCPGFAAILAAVALLGPPGSAAAAWVETAVKAHKAVVDVERTGLATVEQEIALGVRGGPLEDFEIQGVDPDAELEGEARLTPVSSRGNAPGTFGKPIPVMLSRSDDGTLRVEVQSEKGLRSGTYALRFRYRTNLLARDRIRRHGTAAEIEWVSPRFADGIDVATVVFRLPDGPVEPGLANGGDVEPSDLGGAFLSAVRHEGGKAEIEIVRPHVARGEPAVFRVQASPKCFDAWSLPRRELPSEERRLSAEDPGERLGFMALLFGIALGYALLVMLKGSLHARDCEAAGAEVRPLIRLPLGARAALAGTLLSGAVLLAALGEQPTVAALLLLGALGFAALRPCKARRAPRGPGRWLVLTDADAFQDVEERGRHGRFLDAGTRSGALVLAVLLLAIGGSALLLFARAPYHLLAVILASSALLPIFGTGRRVSLPFDRARAPVRLLRGVARGLRARGIKAVAWARIPDGEQDPDELRVLVRAPRAREGLIAVELGVEPLATPAGYVGLPFVIVRVRADSDAHAAFNAGPLARGAVFQRGRRMEERIAIFRPTLPGRAHVLALVEQVLAQAAGAPRVSSRKTRGAVSSTLNGAVRSPAHAT